MTELNKIKKIREQKGLTLRDLERITGIDHSTISRIENGYSLPSQTTMLLIARGLKMDVNEVFYLDWRQHKKTWYLGGNVDEFKD